MAKAKKIKPVEDQVTEQEAAAETPANDTTVYDVNVELEKLNKAGLESLITDLQTKVPELQPHAKKKVMVNRIRYALQEGLITGKFSEPEFDPELEALNQPKVKEVKPEPVYEWKEKAVRHGQQVYTSSGTGNIIGETEDGEHVKVALKEGGEKVFKVTSVRWKAVKDEYRDHYVKDTSIRTASGSPSIHNGDDLASALLGLGLDSLRSIAAENGLSESIDKWGGKNLNPGMIRMNLSNVLRSRIRKGQQVVIDGLADIALAGQRGRQRAEKTAEAFIQAQKEKLEAREKEAAERAEKKAAKLQAKAQAKIDRETAAAEKKAAKPKKVKAADVVPTKEA